MRKSIRNLFIPIAAAVCGMLIVSVGLLLLSMRPIPDGRAAQGVWTVKDTLVNLFIIQGNSGLIAVDAGMNPEKVIQGLEKMSIAASDVHTVLLTHTDPDHSGGISAFPNAVRVLSSLEEPMILGEDERIFFGISRSERNPLANEPYTLVDPGDTLDIDGRTIQVVSTPGHSPGSTTYIVDGRMAFIGDAGVQSRGTIVPLPRLFNNDSRLAERTIMDFLNSYDDMEYIFTAHDGVWSDSRN
ncbi:MAG: MBL fold metallo-hydrolase [Spirochaetaceae bacterium]|nr:MBL fold metallo-hydrolase [Spirochaetaceae bacterium]